MDHVGRQDQHRLQHADGEGAEDHHRKRSKELADVPADERQGKKGDDRGQDRADHRPEDLLATADRRGLRRLPEVLPRRDVLADHDRVVGQHPERDQKAEHGQQVEGDAERGHREQRPADRGEQTDHHPERHPEVEGQQEREKDQPRALKRVPREKFETPLDETGEIVVGDEVRGQRLGSTEPELVRLPLRRPHRLRPDRPGEGLALPSGHVGVGHPRDRHGVLGSGLEDRHAARGRSVEPLLEIDVDEVVADAREITDGQHASIGAGSDHDRADRLRPLRHAHGADVDVAAGPAKRAARKFQRPRPDGVGDGGDGKSVLDQTLGLDRHPEFVVPKTGHLQGAHATKRFEVVDDRAHRRLEHPLVDFAVERQDDDREIRFELHHPDPFGVVGQIRKPLDRPFDVLDRFGDVGPLVELDHQDPRALADRGLDTADLLDASDRILHLAGHRLLDLPRRRAGVDEFDAGRLRIDLREELAAHVESGVDATDDQREHQEVRGDRPAGPERGKTHRPVSPASDVSPTTRDSTRMPSGSDRDASITIRAPSGSGSASTIH